MIRAYTINVKFLVLDWNWFFFNYKNSTNQYNSSETNLKILIFCFAFLHKLFSCFILTTKGCFCIFFFILFECLYKTIIRYFLNATIFIKCVSNWIHKLLQLLTQLEIQKGMVHNISNKTSFEYLWNMILCSGLFLKYLHLLRFSTWSEHNIVQTYA